MKNPHGVEPTRYMKRKESKYAIECNPRYGPIFGDDICINDKCNKLIFCWIGNDGTNGYECHLQYKSSLFVNTNKPENTNRFSVLDYEVYTHN